MRLLYKTLSTILMLIFLQANGRLQRPMAFPAPRSKRALPVTKPTRQLTNTSSDGLWGKRGFFPAQWISDEYSCAQPPTHALIREMATRILHMNADIQPIGNEWRSQLLSRLKPLFSIVGRLFEAPRAQVACTNVIRAFFMPFKRIRID